MEKQLEMVLQKMNENMNEIKEEFRMQTTTLTSDMIKTIEEKLKPLVEENEKLHIEVTTLKKKVQSLEKEVRKNNVILHGIEESEKNNTELLQLVLDTFNIARKNNAMEEFDKWEISNVQRLGKKQDKKRRPILVKLTLGWRKIDILRNNKSFPENAYVTEDFPKEILQIRKELKQKQQEETKKGNVAFIRYDKIIIKNKENQEKNSEKRKRSPSKTPTQSNFNNETSKRAPNKINKTNAFEYMNRSRSNSQPGSSNI